MMRRPTTKQTIQVNNTRMGSFARVPSRGQQTMQWTQPTPPSAVANPKMFCFQCEQTKEQKGCTTIGVCGKTPEVANMQDLLIASMKNLANYARRTGSRKFDEWILDSTFSTLTNVNFDEKRFVEYLHQAQKNLEVARKDYEDACKRAGTTPEPIEQTVQIPKNATAQQLNDIGTKVLNYLI